MTFRAVIMPISKGFVFIEFKLRHCPFRIMAPDYAGVMFHAANANVAGSTGVCPSVLDRGVASADDLQACHLQEVSDTPAKHTK
jgi:hypothetical protein